MGRSSNQPELLTVQQFAALAGKCDRTIRHYIRDKRINAFMFKGMWVISKSEWERTRSYFLNHTLPPKRK